MLVNQIMTRNVQTVFDDDSLGLLTKILNEVSFHHLPVVDSNNILLGIISDRDVMKNLSPFLGTDFERDCDSELMKQSAAEIMSSNPITIGETTRIETASILLLENNFSCLPVVDEDGKLDGLLTWKDILNYYIYSD